MSQKCYLLDFRSRLALSRRFLSLGFS